MRKVQSIRNNRAALIVPIPGRVEVHYFMKGDVLSVDEERNQVKFEEGTVYNLVEIIDGMLDEELKTEGDDKGKFKYVYKEVKDSEGKIEDKKVEEDKKSEDDGDLSKEEEDALKQLDDADKKPEKAASKVVKSVPKK